jgi:hypothetical protein
MDEPWPVPSNQRQVGGDHYASGYQHWDWVSHLGLGYLEGCATKYVARCRKKGGGQDLDKAVHYLDKLIEQNRSRPFRVVHAPQQVFELCDSFGRHNQLSYLQTKILTLIAGWTTTGDLLEAQGLIFQLKAALNAVPLTEENKHAQRVGQSDQEYNP